jgi:hypothetical protein
LVTNQVGRVDPRLHALGDSEEEIEHMWFLPRGKSGTEEIDRRSSGEGATGRALTCESGGAISKPCPETWAHPGLHKADHDRGREIHQEERKMVVSCKG